MKGKKVRHKAHAPTRRTPRYPVQTGPTGYKRRQARAKASVQQPSANTRGLYTKKLLRTGEEPDWEGPANWAVIEASQGLSIKPPYITGDVVILKLILHGFYDRRQRDWGTVSYYAVMPLRHAYWRHLALLSAMRVMGLWSFIDRLVDQDCYAINLPGINVAVTDSLAKAEYLRTRMRRDINKPAR